MKRAVKRALIGVLVVASLGAALVALNLRGEASIPGTAIAPLTAPLPPPPGQVARGNYLALVGDCMACHTAQGGTPYAGGRGVDTPFGTVYAPNLTPDQKTGIGAWSPDHFWRALHNGRSRDGRLLYPAFPYPNYTHITRQDSDAIFAYLRSLPPVEQPNRPHALRFPYDSQLALAVWRAAYFSPGAHIPDPARSGEWNRGAYLVQGLGHCNACHSARNALGASPGVTDLGGGLIPVQNWYAPSLTAAHEAGVADWEPQQIVDLLKKGVSPKASVLGPMAEVVFRSTQYIADDDLRAMAVYLKSLPPAHVQPRSAGSEAARAASGRLFEQGAKVYEKDCASCHGDKGQGAPGAYPALAGNRAVLMDSSVNLVRVVVEGGFAPATAANPRPYGMPPFATALNDEEIAAVATFVRRSWGNDAAPVSPLDVSRSRGPTIQ
jgi:mono/diheme cytochrome c family protein